MPPEVLSYFFEHENEKLKISFQIVWQCAPFLKNLKVSCGISVGMYEYKELELIMEGTGINYKKLLEIEEKCFVLFYREAELSKYMKRIGIRSFIKEYGYEDMEIDAMLEQLSKRATIFKEKGLGFPHEIGIFLGYPLEDVRRFIENSGKGFLFSGYWKVYCNPMEAKMIFNQYDQAKICAVNEFLVGESIGEIAQIRGRY